MDVYILIWFMVMSFYLFTSYKKYNYLSDKQRLETNSHIFTFIMSVLLFISGFRAKHIGADHINYIDEFNVVKNTGDSYFEEKGYVFFNKLVAFFSDDSLVLIFLISLLIIFSVARYIKKNVHYEYYAFALIIFSFQPYLYIQSTFNILRQGCATAILLFSMQYLFEKKWIKYLVIGSIAFTFHSSMIFVIAYLIVIRKMNLTPNIIRAFTVLCLVLNFMKIGNLFFTLFSSHYQTFSTFDETLLNNPIYILVIVIVIFFFTSIYSKLYKTIREKFFVDLFLMGLVFLIFAVQNDMLYRVYVVLAFCSIPGITIIGKNLTQYSFIKTSFMLYYNVFYLGNVLLWHINKIRGYVPYEFIF